MPLPETVSRPLYEQEIARKARSGEVIVIKGVRRSGKSTLLSNEIKRLQSGGMPASNILFVNLEGQRFALFEPLTLLEFPIIGGGIWLGAEWALSGCGSLPLGFQGVPAIP